MANGLERTLAEVEILAKDLDVNYSSFNENYLSLVYGTSHHAKVVFETYKKSIKAMKQRRTPEANRYCAEFALATKNLADNLNLLIQTIYGNSKIEPANLKQNSEAAPKTSSGQSLYELFTSVHSWQRNSPIIEMRNKQGHGEGHEVLAVNPNFPSGYAIHSKPQAFIPINEISGLPDAKLFLDSQSSSYLEMAKKVLETIADNDVQFSEARIGNRKIKTAIQRVKNFYHSHETSLKLAGATTLLVGGILGGSLGTLALQNYQKQATMKKTISKMNYILEVDSGFRNYFDGYEFGRANELKAELTQNARENLQKLLISNPEFCSSYDVAKVFGKNSNLFEQATGSLQEKSKELGRYVDNYISRVSLSFPKSSKIDSFLKDRENFRNSLHQFLDKNKGKAPDAVSLHNLQQLRDEEEKLSDREWAIVGTFRRY